MSIGSEGYARFEKEARTLSREDWGFAYADDTLVRYVDYSDARDCEEILDAIAGLTYPINPYTDGRQIGGNWNLLFVSYEKLPNSDRYRLKHALTSAGSSAGEAYVTENNCTFKVTITFYWRQTAVVTPVTAGSSGITYATGGVTRDSRTGLYSYYVEKREQYTTKVAEHVVANTQFATVYEQQFLGVRESSAGSGVYTKGDDGNVIAALYPMDVLTQGTVYTQSISKNANCTADVTQRKIVAKNKDLAVIERKKTIFWQEVSITHRNETAAIADFVEVVNGIVVTRQARLNDDNTYDNTETIRTAIAVSDAVVQRQRTTFWEEVSITNRNQAAAVNAYVAVSGGIVTTRQSSENEDGTFDNTETLRTAIAGTGSVQSERTVFRDIVTTTLRNQTTAVNALVEVAGGVITTRQSRTNDDGTFDNTETLSTARADTDSVVSRKRTIYFDTVSITNRNQTNAVNAYVAVSGGIVYERTSKKNDDGTYENVESLSTEAAVSNAQTSYRKTAFGAITVVEDRGQTAAKANPTTVGVTVENVQSENGRFTQRTITNTPDTNGGAGIEAQTSTLWENTRKVYGWLKRNLTAKETEPTTATDGEVVRVENTLDEETGTYTAEKVRDIAIKQAVEVSMVDADGPYKVWILENYTEAEATAFVGTIASTAKVSVSPAISRYPGRVSLTVTVRDQADTGAVEYLIKYNHTGLKEYEVRVANPVAGTYYKDTWEITYNIKRGTGLATARTDYAALKPMMGWGSFFEDHGRNWFTYKAVTSVMRVARTDITSDWLGTAEVDLTPVVPPSP